MSWKSFVRDLERAQRRAERNRRAAEREYARNEREAARHQRELEKRLKQQQKLEEAEAAKLELAQFESYLEMLVSVHKQPGLAWDWQASATTSPPVAPARSDESERKARAVREAYTPGFFDRLFGQVEKKVAKLDAEIIAARQQDDARLAEANEKWKEAHATWSQERALGQRIVAMDVRAYGEALVYAGAFDEISAYGASVTVSTNDPTALLVNVEITDAEIVPTELLKLTSSGKRSSKPMPKAQYWDLYQDHVCSCAIRVASEVFAALPVNRAVVNIGSAEISDVTGHRVLVTKLGVHFTRAQLVKLNLDRIDPSSSMANFPHRMQFAKTSGFKPVDSMSLEEQFITT